MPEVYFLELPLELRYETYDCFFNNRNLYVQYPADPKRPSDYKNLLLTCRQINIEIRSFLLRKTPEITFTFPHPTHLPTFLQTLSPKIPLKCIRHLGFAYPNTAIRFYPQPSEPSKLVSVTELLHVVPGLELDTLTFVTELFKPEVRHYASYLSPRADILLRTDLHSLADCPGWRHFRCICHQNSFGHNSRAESALHGISPGFSPRAETRTVKEGEVELAQAIWPLEERDLERFREKGWVFDKEREEREVGWRREIPMEVVGGTGRVQTVRADVAKELRELLAAKGGNWERVVEKYF